MKIDICISKMNKHCVIGTAVLAIVFTAIYAKLNNKINVLENEIERSDY